MTALLHKRMKAILKDYIQCISVESKGSPLYAICVAYGVILARINYHMGPLYYSLFRFSDVPKNLWGNYLTNEQLFISALKNNVSASLYNKVENKALFYQHCLEHKLPTIPIICIVGKLPDSSFNNDMTLINTFKQWQAVIETCSANLFVKPVYGYGGVGAFQACLLKNKFIFGENRIEGTSEELFDYILSGTAYEKAYIIQPLIRAHTEILKFSSPNGLPTVRIVTGMESEKPEILAACIRLSVGNNTTDNFSSGTSGNLVAAIDIETGILSKAWRSARTDWPLMEAVDFHPDTGQRICGSIMPLWSEVIDLALKAQSSLPDLKTAGWDIAVTDNGVLLLEANCYYGVVLLQVAYQKGLKRELSKFYE